ncbi:MAG TPA: helix-turn-helix domain-containing protein [Terriglobales bacterium]|nr:helix-turn-helix domain-containing protein [Terriglobales bacterium]
MTTDPTTFSARSVSGDRNVGGFGERLRREREMRGIALDEISTATKISNRFLRALEEEKFDQLPGGIFNKGFVRAYAKFLGIDEDQAIADYTSAVGAPLESEQDVELTETLERWKRPEPEELQAKRSEERSSWSAIAVLVVLGVLVFAGWTYIAKRKAEREAREAEAAVAAAAAAKPPAVEPEAARPSPPAADVAPQPQPRQTTPPSQNPAAKTALAPAAAKPVAPAAAPADATTAAAGAKPPPTGSATSPGTSAKPAASSAGVASTATPAPRPADGASANANTNAAANRAPAGLTTEPARTEAPPAKAPIRLVVRARQDSWISITADGKLIMRDTLLAGAEKSVRAQSEVVLVMGNAAGVDVSYNGQALPALGDQGQVKTVTFTPTGYQ